MHEYESRPDTEAGAPTDEYEARMLEAFVGKPDAPEKGLWYANAFSKYNINGVDVIKWNWSWWAFFGGMWFLIYRKAYAAAGGLFLLSFAAAFIPFAGIVLWVLSGGYSSYFVYRVYKEKKSKIEQSVSDEDQRIAVMREIGGYNAWAAWVLPVIFLLGVLAAIVLPKFENTDGSDFEHKIEMQMNEFQMRQEGR